MGCKLTILKFFQFFNDIRNLELFLSTLNPKLMDFKILTLNLDPSPQVLFNKIL